MAIQATFFSNEIDDNTRTILRNRAKAYKSGSAGGSAALTWLNNRRAGVEVTVTSLNSRSTVTLSTYRRGGLAGQYTTSGDPSGVYRPRTVLKSVTVDTAGELYSLQKAKIEFTVFSQAQLAEVQPFFEIGNDITITGKWYGASADYADEYKFTGMIHNFNFTLTANGGFDCSVECTGPGVAFLGVSTKIGFDVPMDAIGANFTLPWVENLIRTARNNTQAQAFGAGATPEPKTFITFPILLEYMKSIHLAGYDASVSPGIDNTVDVNTLISRGLPAVQVPIANKVFYSPKYAGYATQNPAITEWEDYNPVNNYGSSATLYTDKNGVASVIIASPLALGVTDPVENSGAPAGGGGGGNAGGFGDDLGAGGNAAAATSPAANTTATRTGGGTTTTPSGQTRTPAANTSNFVDGENKLLNNGRITYITLSGVIELIQAFLHRIDSNFESIKLNGAVIPTTELPIGLVSLNWVELLIPGTVSYYGYNGQSSNSPFENATDFDPTTSQGLYTVDGSGGSRLLIGLDWLISEFDSFARNRQSTDTNVQDYFIRFINQILDMVARNTCNFFKFTMVQNPLDTNEWIVVNNNYVPHPTNFLYEIPVQINGGVATAVQLTGKLPTDMQTAAYVNNRARSGMTGLGPTNIPAIQDKDRTAGAQSDEGPPTTDDINSVLARYGTEGLTTETIEAARGVFERLVYAKYGIANSKSGGSSANAKKYASVVPLELSMTLEGIAGLKFGNSFTISYIPDNLTPKNGVFFTITKITQKFSNDGAWNTDVSTLMRIADETFTPKSI